MSDKDKKKIAELKKKHRDINVPDKDIKNDKSFKKSLENVLNKDNQKKNTLN
ncbi:MAG: hypothetical protein WD048_00255 [Chitinophagales bacterium]